MTLRVNEELNTLLLHTCTNSHEFADDAKMIVWVSAYCLLNNHCSSKNDQITRPKLTKQRKLSSLNNQKHHSLLVIVISFILVSTCNHRK